MNERIQVLMEQAMELVDPYALEGEFGPRRLNEEKFAELIVRECASIAGMNDDDTLSEGDIRAGSIKRQIKEHFGVKE